jgi:hypothetical protein
MAMNQNQEQCGREPTDACTQINERRPVKMLECLEGLTRNRNYAQARDVGDGYEYNQAQWNRCRKDKAGD